MTSMPMECEACPTTLASLVLTGKKLIFFKGTWFCPSCHAKEVELTEISAKEADKRVEESRAQSNSLVDISRQIDQTIQLREDVFNAHTVAIMDLKKAIDEDTTIENKPLFLAEELHKRYSHLAKVVFDARSMIVDATNQQRAIHTYMATLSNQLRAEEREKLKLQDINYHPETPKTPKVRGTSSKPRTAKKIATLAECKEMAGKFNIPVEMLRMRLTVKTGETLEEAAREIAKKMGTFTPANSN